MDVIFLQDPFQFLPFYLFLPLPSENEEGKTVKKKLIDVAILIEPEDSIKTNSQSVRFKKEIHMCIIFHVLSFIKIKIKNKSNYNLLP